MSDPLGDELQAAATEVAAKWGPERYTPNVRDAIKDFLRRGERAVRSCWSGGLEGSGLRTS